MHEGRGTRSFGALVLMLTGMSSLANKEVGFEAGADDYLTKPFQGREVALRAKALLRRGAGSSASNELKHDALTLDPVAFRATFGEKNLSLTPKEFALLEYFLRHPRQLLTVESLLFNIWRSEEGLTEHAMRNCLQRLRKKLGEPCPIKTIHGSGYILD